MPTQPTIAIAQQAVDEAGTPADRTDALLTLSTVFERHGNYDASLLAAEEAYQIAEKIDNKEAMAVALRCRAIIAIERGHYQTALEWLHQAVALCVANDDAIGAALANGNIGYLYQHTADFPRALEYMNKALTTLEALQERAKAAFIMGNIGSAYGEWSDYPRALEYMNKALAEFEAVGNRFAAANITGNIGYVLFQQSDYPRALEYMNKALAEHEALGNMPSAANVIGNIGIVSFELADYPRALECFVKALAEFEVIGDRARAARMTGNIGSVYRILGDYPHALEYFTKVHDVFTVIGHAGNAARAIASIGGIHHELQEYSEALERLSAAVEAFRKVGDRDGVAQAAAAMGRTYLELLDPDRALECYTNALEEYEAIGNQAGVARITQNIGVVYCMEEFQDYNPTKGEELMRQAVALNKKLGRKDYDVHHALSQLYQQQGRWEESLTEFQTFYKLKQEIESEEAKKKAAQVEQQRQIAEMEKRTAAERADAEATKRVLHNILTPTIAQRVVQGEEHIAESFESVTVLFADIVGFTVLSQHISATELVSGLDVLFSQFDELAEKHGLEKIKTIGDAYMAVAGLPEAWEDHAKSAAQMAMEMVDVVKEFAGLGGDSHLEVRIGLHTGEVVAGIIGKKKFAYDLWGDAVNVASRMESHGVPGKIHVSQQYVQAVGASATFTHRGVMEVKGRGMMETYFLEEILRSPSEVPDDPVLVVASEAP